MPHDLFSFDQPTKLPTTSEEATEWQKTNEIWWNSNPMRYDWKQSIPHDEFSPEFFAEIDRRFVESSRHYLPWKKTPFDQLINYDALSKKDVLEIGIGNGTHAQLLASNAHTFTGIDITDYAARSGMIRFESTPTARILKMDAEKLEFDDASFDFVWSWGVIHHSSNTKKILEEIGRVLRPGGTATVMVYHRGWFNYYFIGALIYGILLRGFLGGKSIHQLVQQRTDGAIARYYTATDFKRILPQTLRANASRILGQKEECLPIPGGVVKKKMLSLIPDFLARIFTNTLRGGSFLVISLRKA